MCAVGSLMLKFIVIKHNMRSKLTATDHTYVQAMGDEIFIFRYVLNPQMHFKIKQTV